MATLDRVPVLHRRQDMLDAADARIEAIRADFPDAAVLDRRDVRLLILLGDRESMHKMTVEAAGT